MSTSSNFYSHQNQQIFMRHADVTIPADFKFHQQELHITSFIMSSIKNPLAAILDSNKFTGLNYQDWLRNLNIVLASEKLLHTIEKSPPKEAPADISPEELVTLQQWWDDELKTRCYLQATEELTSIDVWKSNMRIDWFLSASQTTTFPPRTTGMLTHVDLCFGSTTSRHTHTRSDLTLALHQNDVAPTYSNDTVSNPIQIHAKATADITSATRSLQTTAFHNPALPKHVATGFHYSTSFHQKPAFTQKSQK
ncbi:hypothetical protein F511_11721 [Dorcoceras hygrometricum]|uniref:Uncharacterized protein n=1 Tax=Dorcoceras hygrometricum TaxID=472368 RepID=A0A2Z7ACX4_9LAMI|nr:hypothetical protein F511_11721 [Dorcoceras hygrometricum]